jgi:carbonic anhydrase
LLSHITPAIHSCGESAGLTEVIKRNAELNGQAMIERSAIIRQAVEGGKLDIVAAYYKLGSGEVEFV